MEVNGFSTEDTEKDANIDEKKTHLVDTIDSWPYDFV
jgi:hypothetical protein